MPMTDYTDPEIKFPRLQVRIRQIEPDAYWLKIWLWEKAGTKRQVVVNRKCSGAWRDAHQLIEQCSEKYRAQVGPDDIWVEDNPPQPD